MLQRKGAPFSGSTAIKQGSAIQLLGKKVNAKTNQESVVLHVLSTACKNRHDMQCCNERGTVPAGPLALGRADRRLSNARLPRGAQEGIHCGNRGRRGPCSGERMRVHGPRVGLLQTSRAAQRMREHAPPTTRSWGEYPTRGPQNLYLVMKESTNSRAVSTANESQGLGSARVFPPNTQPIQSPLPPRSLEGRIAALAAADVTAPALAAPQEQPRRSINRDDRVKTGSSRSCNHLCLLCLL